MRRAAVLVAVLAVVGCGGDQDHPAALGPEADAACEASYLERCEVDAAAVRGPGEVYTVRTGAMVIDEGRILCGCCMTEDPAAWPGGEVCWVNDPQ